MEPISPELVLVDPELAARARALLPTLDAPVAPAAVVDIAPPAAGGRAQRLERAFLRVAAWLVIPSLALNVALLRADGAAAPAPGPVATVSARALSEGIPLGVERKPKPKPKPKQKP